MITTFRNLEISNQLLDLNITDSIFKKAKKVFKNDLNLKVSHKFNYCILKPKYKMIIHLGQPDYSHGGDKVVDLFEKLGKDTDNETWYQISDARFNFVPNTNEILNINELLTGLKLKFVEDLIFNNVGEFKTAIINKLRTKETKNDYTYAEIETNLSEDSKSLITLINTINWLYDTDFDITGCTDKQLKDLSSKFSNFEWEIGLYYKVKDLPDNRRLILVAFLGDSYKGYNYRYRCYNNLSWKIIDVPHDNPAYNYIDEGTYGANFEKQIPGKLQFDPTVKSLPKTIDPLKHAISRRKDQIHVFDQNAIDKANKKYMLKVAMEKDNEKTKEAVKLKISSRIKNIDKQPLKLNEAIFTNEKIEYSGQILKSDEVKIEELLIQLYKFHDLDDINYDRAFEMFITTLIKQVMSIDHDKDVNAQIGDINVTLHRKTGFNKFNNFYAVYYINKIRINKDEFDPLLQRAACFENVATYNEFLRQVSVCSLKIHGLLDRGIDVTVINPLRRERITLKLELVRKNKRQHLKIGKHTFLIRNTTKIVNLPKKEYLDDVIDVLLNPENVKNITPANLKTLVIQARKAYIDAIEKAKQLLETTIDKFNLEKTKVITKNKAYNGYIVPGKIKTYFVAYDQNKHTSNCSVFTYPDMNYICIVDKTPNQQIGVDKFVNRIYALANDQFLAKQIYTLNTQK